MTRTVAGFLGLLALLPALQLREKPETPNPAQQYYELDKEYRKASEEYLKALAKVKTAEEAKKLRTEKAPYPEDFAPRFLELAEKYPEDPAAVDALLWIVRLGRMNRDQQSKDARKKALQILIRDHVQSEKMTALYPALGSVSSGHAQDKDSQQLLHAVLEKNQHRRAQAFACLALAEQAEGYLRASREIKDDPDRGRKKWEFWLSTEVVDALAKADPDKLCNEAEAYYERFSKDYADVTDARGNKLDEAVKKSAAK